MSDEPINEQNKPGSFEEAQKRTECAIQVVKLFEELGDKFGSPEPLSIDEKASLKVTQSIAEERCGGRFDNLADELQSSSTNPSLGSIILDLKEIQREAREQGGESI